MLDPTPSAESTSASSLPAAGAAAALLMLVLLGGALGLHESPPTSAGASRETLPNRILSSKTFAYREHAEPERTVSSIEFRIEARGEDSAELVVEASAVGPLVQPPRGFRYRAGENPITAREIAELEAAERLSVVTTDRKGGREQQGEVRLGEPHMFTERKISLDGTLKNVNGRKLPSGLHLASGTLTEGEYEFAIFLDGAPRLQVQFQLEEGARTGSIGDVRALHPEDEELNP